MKNIMLCCVAVALSLTACQTTSSVVPPVSSMSPAAHDLYRAEHKGNNPPSTVSR
jgi:hypothetical protein